MVEARSHTTVQAEAYADLMEHMSALMCAEDLPHSRGIEGYSPDEAYGSVLVLYPRTETPPIDIESSWVSHPPALFRQDSAAETVSTHMSFALADLANRPEATEFEGLGPDADPERLAYVAGRMATDLRGVSNWGAGAL